MHTERTPPASDDWKKSPGKKNTKKWCKGKVGRAHKPDIRPTNQWSRTYTCGLVFDKWRLVFWQKEEPFWECFHEEYCTVCGKILQWRLPASMCPTRHEDPTSHSKITLSSPEAPY